MTDENRPFPRPQARRRKASGRTCVCCRTQVEFCWTCPCGFAICQPCMDENAWGMTCNYVTWECPDCGTRNAYANQ